MSRVLKERLKAGFEVGVCHLPEGIIQGSANNIKSSQGEDYKLPKNILVNSMGTDLAEVYGDLYNKLHAEIYGTSEEEHG